MLTYEDELILLRNGFIEYEIQTFSEARTPDGQIQPPLDLDSPLWQSVLKSRRDWTIDKVDKGWLPEEIKNSLMSYYAAKEGRSPWDWLRLEYHPVGKLDYKGAMARRKAKERTAEFYRK